MSKIKNPKDMKSIKPKKFSEVLAESTINKVEVTLPPVEDKVEEPKVESEVITEETVAETTTDEVELKEEVTDESDPSDEEVTEDSSEE